MLPKKLNYTIIMLFYFFPVITITTPSETLYGDALLLVCSSVALPTEYASRAHIQWWGPNGTSLDGMNGIAVGEQTSDDETSSRNLAFDFLRSFMDGVYTCQFYIRYMNETYTETKNYSLMVSGKCIAITMFVSCLKQHLYIL